MVNIYDQAHALAKAIRESEEYTLYERAKEAAMENETNKALLGEYKKLQFQLQVQMAGGASPSADNQVYKWLAEHCWEYGFILRYLDGKSAITGIYYEPWHVRYVGTEVSLDMKESGLCLEEYLGAVTQ